jgi:hypothetical protein
MPVDEPMHRSSQPNPYDAPTNHKNAIGAEFGGELAVAEQIRRAHLVHEACIKAIGWLYYLPAIFVALSLLAFVFSLATGLETGLQTEEEFGSGGRSVQILGLVAFHAVVFALLSAVGYGLYTFRRWARWTCVVLTSLVMLYMILGSVLKVIVGSAISAVILIAGFGISVGIMYLLLAAKARVVFSSEYREIVARTPHIRYKRSLFVLVVGLPIVLMTLVAIAGTLLSH